MKRFLPFLLAAFMPAVGALAQRQIVDLPDHWKFIKHDAAPELSADSPDWQAITVPHSYNALDGQNGHAVDGGYYRGPTWYQRTLDIPADWKEKRVFIRFEGAFLVSEVFLNGEKIGEHRGGFAAFCYELTPKLKIGAANDLRVRVNNARQNDVAPLSADFTMEGGIYRPVHLIVTDKVCITPLDYAGPGVYVTPANVSENGADVEIETKINCADAGNTEQWNIQTTLLDADGRSIHLKDTGQTVQISPVVGITQSGSYKQKFHLDRPHLWQGIKDPYFYTVEVALYRRERKTVGQRIADDRVTVPLGLRTVAIDNAKGFLLNGEPYPVYGVNRHQEKKDKGWALSHADQEQDLLMIREMGATAVRLAHYQQATDVHDIADKMGLLLWQEIPLVDSINDGEAFAANAKQQLTEMIRQCSNHPSIFTWSMFNELVHPKSAPPEGLIADLDKLARELDPTRTPTCASCRPDLPPLNRITEWIGFNIYPGWYIGKTDDDGFGPPTNFNHHVQKSVDAAGGNKRVAISEYGAGANPAQHQEGPLTQVKPFGPFHPEEWQTYVHEVAWLQARNNPSLWGTFVWVMFDFAVDGRNEGSTPGINDKGMVTQDRQTKKDAFYFYKANWNPEPMVYITSRRMVDRVRPTTQIKAYTNCAEAELTLNGQSLGKRQPTENRILRWENVALQPGKNVVELTARAPDGKTLSDHCEWTLKEPPPAPAPTVAPAASVSPTASATPQP